MAEYRPIPEERRDDRIAITKYAFDPASGPYDPEEEIEERRRRMWSFGDRRGMFEGEELLVCCTHVEFTVNLRGRWLSLAGLSGVASPPEHRRKGLVGELMAASLEEYRDRGWPVSALRPFDEAFYARYGWATGCRYRTATVEPSALSVAEDATAGEFRRIEPDEHERIEPAYEAWLDGTNLRSRRSADWWRDRVFQSFESELYCYAWERDGRVRGYLVYRVEGGEDGRRLKAHEVAYADHEAYLNLLRFCYYHDSQVEEVELYGPRHDRLLDVASDRDAVEVTEAAGQMVRVVDVPAALEAVPYPGVEAADLAVDADPDASLDVGTLSQLLVGYRSVERARQAGDARVRSPDAAETLAALFPEREVFLPESF